MACQDLFQRYHKYRWDQMILTVTVNSPPLPAPARHRAKRIKFIDGASAHSRVPAISKTSALSFHNDQSRLTGEEEQSEEHHSLATHHLR